MPQSTDALQHRCWACQDRSKRRIEVLVHRDVNGVEERRVLRWSNAGVSRGQVHARAVQVKSNLLLAGIGAYLFHLFEVEDLARGSANRRLDGDRAHRNGERRPTGPLHNLAYFLELDGRPSWRQRDEIESAQQLRAVAFVAI